MTEPSLPSDPLRSTEAPAGSDDTVNGWGRAYPIRSALVGLVAIPLLALFAALAYEIFLRTQDDIANATRSAEVAAESTATQTEEFLARAVHILAELSHRPKVQALDPADCDPLLADVKRLHPAYANVLTLDANGRLVCSASGIAAGQAAGPDPKYYFAQTVRTGKFTVGKPAKGFVTGRWVSTLAYPIHNRDGQLTGVVAVAVDLATYRPLVVQKLPPASVVTIINGEGALIARSEDSAQRVGSIARSELITKALEQRQGTARGRGFQGIDRFIAFAPIPGSDWIAMVSLDAAIVLAPARRLALEHLLIALAAALAIAAFALRLSRRISAPIESIAGTIAAVKSGAEQSRAAVKGPTEIRHIAVELNAMLDARAQAEASLRESDARLRFSIKAANVGLWDWDLISNAVNFSPEWKAQIGYQDDEIPNRFDEWQSRVHPDDLESTLRKVRANAASPIKLHEVEFRFRHKDGSYRWIYANASVVCDEHGKPVRMLGCHTDITELKLSEEKLRDAETRATAVLESISDSFVTWDRDWRFNYVNPAAERTLHHPRQDMLGQDVRTLFHPDPADPLRLQYEHAMAERRPVNFEAWHALLEIWVEARAVPAVDGGLAVFFRDITERKHAEQRIRQQLEHLSLLDQITRSTGERLDIESILQIVLSRLEEALPVDFACVCLHDPAAGWLQVAAVGPRSETLARELGLEPHAVIEIERNGLSPCVQGQLVYEPDVNRLSFPFYVGLVRGGLGSVVLAPLRSEHGSFRVLVMARRKAQSFSGAECEFMRQLGEHVGLVAHQAELYGSLQQAYDDLRQNQAAAMQEERLRVLGQMASGVAHDINNALSPVSMYVDLMLDSERNLSGRSRGYLETIQRAVEDVANTVARLREFYRQREPQLVLAPVNVNDMAQQVLELTRARWSDMSLQRGVVIDAVTDLAPGLPRIMGVESEIREALTNLVFNAVDSMTEGGTLVLRTLLAGDPPEQSVIVEVVDTGAGMDEETRLRCLEPFFTTKGERGTGLGLAMVFGMVQRHGAEIEIDSAPGAGTTVRLVFAVAPAGQAEPGQPAVAPVVPTRLRLLLMDDDPVLLKSLHDMLEADGNSVVTANGGEAGIAAFRAALDAGEPFAAVITDLGMPYVDGRRVAMAIKEASPATPVILLTGWGQRLMADGEIPAHVDQVLAKPPRRREVRAALARLCRTANAASSPSA